MLEVRPHMQAEDMARDDFSEPVKLALAKRASYICSNPECRVLTIAPSDVDPLKVIYVGKAAHITAASSGGPRFDESLSPEARASITNAIFLCSTCADTIDKNGGLDFSESSIKKWKEEHDEWVRSNLNKRREQTFHVVDGLHEASGIGHITGLSINEPTIIKPGTVVRATGLGTVVGTSIGSSQRRADDK